MKKTVLATTAGLLALASTGALAWNGTTTFTNNTTDSITASINGHPTSTPAKGNTPLSNNDLSSDCGGIPGILAGCSIKYVDDVTGQSVATAILKVDNLAKLTLKATLQSLDPTINVTIDQQAIEPGGSAILNANSDNTIVANKK